MTPIWAVGLMTGTVLDGNIDVALIKTDGLTVQEFGAFELVPYPNSINAILTECLQTAQDWQFKGQEPTIFAKAERLLTQAQASAVTEVVQKAGLVIAQIGIIGFHGQTVLHRAPVDGHRGPRGSWATVR